MALICIIIPLGSHLLLITVQPYHDLVIQILIFLIQNSSSCSYQGLSVLVQKLASLHIILEFDFPLRIVWNLDNLIFLFVCFAIILKHQNCPWLNCSVTKELLPFVFVPSLLYLHFKTYQYTVRDNSPKVGQHCKDLCLSNCSKPRKIGYCLHKKKLD